MAKKKTGSKKKATTSKKTGSVKKKAPTKKKTAPKKVAPKKAESTTHDEIKSPLSEKELKKYKQMLLDLHDRIVDEIKFLSGDNLNRSSKDSSGDLSGYSMHMADQGTDNFDREFALNLVSGEQDVLWEIDEALQRIEQGTYGVCEMTGTPIQKKRLDAIPYARLSLEAQAEQERGRKRYRPFGPTISHG